MNIKKATLICWVIAGLSLIAYLVNVVVMVNIENWNHDVSAALRVTDYVIRTSLGISLVLGIILMQRSKKSRKL